MVTLILIFWFRYAAPAPRPYQKILSITHSKSTSKPQKIINITHSEPTSKPISDDQDDQRSGSIKDKLPTENPSPRTRGQEDHKGGRTNRFKIILNRDQI